MSVLFFTGAGISVNAGIPAYRSTGTSWDNPDLEAKSHANRYGNHLDELWTKHWGPLCNLFYNAEPTHTHRAIAEFQKNHTAIIATQNIDDLHEQAGSDNVAHLHGTMDVKCMRCKKNFVVEHYESGVPECPYCGAARTRPDVVLFGEMLDKKMFAGLENFVAHEVSHVISIGSSLNVFPAAGLVFDAIRHRSAKVIIINKEPTPFDKWAQDVYNDDCDQVIDEVLEAVDKEKSA